MWTSNEKRLLEGKFENVMEALADLRRKANVNISRSDDIKKILAELNNKTKTSQINNGQPSEAERQQTGQPVIGLVEENIN